VRVRSLDRCEARIVGYADRAIISVSADSTPRRRRYSVGHELGHWHHHRGRNFNCRSSDIDNAANDPLNPERQADEYAADLLMPWYLFEPMLGNAKEVDVSLLTDIADRFDTSLPATAIRIVEANIEPVIVGCYAESGRRWFRASKDVPQRWWPVAAIDKDTYAYDVLRGTRQTTHMSTVGADAWFDEPGCDEYEMKEQSIRLSNAEVLVILRIVDEHMQSEFRPRRTDHR
jgi:hypothetical protein